METKKIVPSNELYHHGVKGQRWGVRRYQNYDGSLKNANKKKYIKSTLNNLQNKKADAEFRKNRYTGYISYMDKKIAKAKEKGKSNKVEKYNKVKNKWENCLNTSVSEIKQSDSAIKKTIDTASKAGWDISVKRVKQILPKTAKEEVVAESLTIMVLGAASIGAFVATGNPIFTNSLGISLSTSAYGSGSRLIKSKQNVNEYSIKRHK